MYSELALHIGGFWIANGGRKTENVVDPATGKALAMLPHATADDLDRALAASAEGFAKWRAASPFERSGVLRKAATLLRDRAEGIARILTQEQGKVLAEAKGEVAMSADVIDWYAEEGKRAYGRIVPGRTPGVRQLVMQEPVGPVAAFTPWNFPALTPVRKIAGALGAGCSIIIKPSEETPGTCVEIVRAFLDAGLPAEALSLVFGVPAEVSAHLIASPIIRKISFTGSVPVGKHLTSLAAQGMKRTTMELGGHAPVVVFGDVDPEQVADVAVAGKYRNAGQVCISPTRFYVQEAVHERFVKRFIERASALRVGNGLESSSTMGPLANSRRVEQMERLLADARGRGAKVAAGGGRLGNQGNFFQPTVVLDVPDDARIMTEEPFGPLAPIAQFKSFDEVVARANALPFGLAAYAFTASTKTATAIGDALEAGMVGVNSLAISTPETPFGGVKESGHGQEGGLEGLEAYTSRKFISQA